MVPQTGLKGAGVLVPVVGPVGGRMDELIASARQVYSQNPAIVFTRSLTMDRRAGADPDAGLSIDEFSDLISAGAFAVTWEDATGSYGIPVSIFDDLTAGRVVVISVARAVIPELRRRHSRVHVVYLTSGHHSRRQALADKDGSWLARITRPQEPGSVIDIPEPPVTVINTSSALSEAIDEFLGVLESYVPMSD